MLARRAAAVRVARVTGIGVVSVAAAREVVDALGAEHMDPLELLGEAQAAIAPRHPPERGSAEWTSARARVVALIEGRGWLVHQSSDAIDLVADALAAGDRLGVVEFFDNLDRYADAADAVAAMEIRSTLDRPDPASRLELVVLGTVLGGALFNALRMLAHQHQSAHQLGAPSATQTTNPREPGSAEATKGRPLMPTATPGA